MATMPRVSLRSTPGYVSFMNRKRNGAARAPLAVDGLRRQAENDEPQPQVVVAFGFLITNCAPSSPSW